MHRELSLAMQGKPLLKNESAFFFSLSQDFAQKVAHRSPKFAFFRLCVFILVLSFFFYFWGETGTDYVI